MSCCRCNRSGRCKNCSCTKSGKPCRGCLPQRQGNCSNNGPTSQPPQPTTLSSPTSEHHQAMAVAQIQPTVAFGEASSTTDSNVTVTKYSRRNRCPRSNRAYCVRPGSDREHSRHLRGNITTTPYRRTASASTPPPPPLLPSNRAIFNGAPSKVSTSVL